METTTETTLYERWNNNEPGTTNLGGFETLMMQAYRHADGTNRDILSKAYPYWFMTATQRKEYEASRRLISEQRRSDLLCSALEGGSNYWYYLPDVTMTDKYRTKGDGDTLVELIMRAVMAGEKIPVTDCNERKFTKDGEHRLGYISLENMDRAEQIMLEKQAAHFADVLEENDDATTGDVWFQLVVMGEVVFG